MFTTRRRRGMTAVLAMLYLTLLSVLAVGFYAATTTATQVSYNEKRVCQASIAAESGMEFMRYQLGRIVIPHGTTIDTIFPTVYQQLQTNLNNTPNFYSKQIALSNGIISIPGPTGSFVSLDTSGMQFRATIESLGQKLRVKVTGQGANASLQRAVQMDYDLAQRASSIFDFGVASRGKISTGGSSRIRGATDPTKGSVLSTCMTDPVPVSISGKEVSGDISVTNPNASVYVGNNASVGGSTSSSQIAQHIHKGVTEPEFPTIDTTAFQAYATNSYSGTGTMINMRIPPNTNPKFTGNKTIKGVLFIEAPNKVEFGGNVDLQGVIIAANAPSGDVTTNQISFKGNVTVTGVETLPDSFGNLKKLTGSFILAPNFATSFTGSFGTVNGSLISGQVSMSGNAEGTVMGSVINLSNSALTVMGSSEIIIASTGTTNYPAGVFFSSTFAPLADTYEEVKP